jgi:hypothetical protein
MRRVLPWALLGLLGVAGLLGAALGLANQPTGSPAGPKASAVIAATVAAGTARYSFSSLTSSNNPLLRTVARGHGSADFAADSMATNESNTGTGVSRTGNEPPRRTTETIVDSEIWIGRTVYFQFLVPGLPAQWIKEAGFPVKVFGTLGVLGSLGPLSQFIAAMEVPGATVESLGRQTLDGTVTTKYRVDTPSCAKTTKSPLQESIGSTYLWIDGKGRLAQAQGVVHVTISSVPASSRAFGTGPPAGKSTTVSTVRLFDFGAPMTITAPKAITPSQEGSAAIALRKTQGCSL